MSPWSLPRRLAKRTLDVFASSVGLVLLAPLLVAIGVAVRATSPGPALFRQPRVGRGARLFRILKFRTMVVGAERRGPAITADGDARVTPLGRWLRRTKLDELPQLINVWLGDMSLVGPRPEVPRYLPCYDANGRVALSVRPGITDPASLRLRDEEQLLARFCDTERAYIEVLLPLKLDLARDYVARQSILGDLFLIMRTLGRL